MVFRTFSAIAFTAYLNRAYDCVSYNEIIKDLIKFYDENIVYK